MWIGKIALILYVFSFGLLFMGYFVNQVFADPILASNQSITYDALHSIVVSFSFNQTPDPALIFGDFLSAFKLVFGLMTGSVFTDSMQLLNASGIGFNAIAVGLLTGGMFDLATALLLLYILSGRSL